MKTHAIDAMDLLREYVAKQGELCAALLGRYAARGEALLLEVPRHGSVSTKDSFWEFDKHGRGVRFCRVPESEAIDVPIELEAYPHAVDTWRLLEHLESRGIEQLKYGGQEFDATQTDGLDRLLRRLCSDCILSEVKKGLYTFVDPKDVGS